MDIELVKKAQKAFEWYDKAVDNSIDYLNLEREEQQNAWNALDKLFEAEIARQSATSEEVAEAIVYLQPMTEHSIMSGNFAKHLKTAITALQAYQPTISKTETVGCEWCDNADEMEVNVKTVSDSGKWVGIKRFSSSKSTFCPNCGRKLKGETI